MFENCHEEQYKHVAILFGSINNYKYKRFFENHCICHEAKFSHLCKAMRLSKHYILNGKRLQFPTCRSSSDNKKKKLSLILKK